MSSWHARGALCLLTCGCGEVYAQTASCPESFEQRLSVAAVALDDSIRYRARAYDNIARDEPIAFALGPDDKPYVAWLNNAGNTVHVSSLNPDGSHRASDVTLPSSEVAGLAVRKDGFMLFTSGPDPGEGLLDPNVAGAVDPVNRAALLSRYRDRRGGFEYSLPLTGTRQIAPEGGEQRRDCTPVPLTGRLASLGDLYAAYFAVHGCQGHPSEGFYGDKLVYMNDEGEYQQGGFAWRCSISEGLQLLPEAGRFTSLCLSENMASPGLNLLLENQTKQLSVEAYTQGYVAAQFGSAIKMPDGSYVIGWLSRGTTDRPKVPEKAAPDIALMHLAPDYSVVSDKVWLTDTLDVAENNLHLAPYGPDRVLVIWDAVDVLERHGETGFGLYTGTRARLFDTAGLPVGDEQALPAPPNGGDDISVHANGDLGWAFVPDPSRSYEKTLEIDTQGVPLGIPIRRELAIARLSYCP